MITKDLEEILKQRFPGKRVEWFSGVIYRNADGVTGNETWTKINTDQAELHEGLKRYRYCGIMSNLSLGQMKISLKGTVFISNLTIGSSMFVEFDEIGNNSATAANYVTFMGYRIDMAIG